MRRFILISILAVVVLSSCKKEVEPNSEWTADIGARDALYGLMYEWYYWYKDIPVTDKKLFDNPYDLLQAMKYKPVDRWSYSVPYDVFTSYYAGAFAGHGYYMGIDGDNKARIAYIYKKSPLFASGVRRGWEIKKVNGVDIAPLYIANDPLYNTIMGPKEAGVPNTFLFGRPGKTDTTIVSTKASFNVNSVLLADTLHLSSGITGHLVFESFIEPSVQELDSAFAIFQAANVTDLIIDLRYNGGGMLSVAHTLASYIIGNGATDKVFVRYKHNDKKISENETTYFKTTTHPLGLSRLVVISSRESASASEVIINSLRAHIPVTLIGDTTYGKPTGMYLFGYPSTNPKYAFVPVTFSLFNAQDQGDFFDGIPVTNYVPDDLTRDFNNRDELCLKESIAFLTGQGTKSAYVKTSRPLLSKKPEWQSNTIVIKDIKPQY